MLRRQKPQPDLQVPVPNFPLSSPISEEISSPSCSSAESHEEERNRPFAFLSKATREKFEGKVTKGSRSPVSSHREASRLHIRGITKKRKSVARPVGLNLVTDFTLAPAPRKHPTVENTQAAPFVDLNDLKLLSKVRERERSVQRSKDMFKRVSRSFQQPPDGSMQSPSQTHNTNLSLNGRDEDPFHDRHEYGISPSDRNVMIGLTVPRNESIERSRELDRAGGPLTPSIIVTPAREEAPWNAKNPGPEMLRPRATSSIYSQPTPRLWQFDSDIPPVPAIPVQHAPTKSTATEPQYSKPLSVERNTRAISTASSWEDDSPPSTPAQVHSTHQTRLSVNTAEPDRPQSQGWWTYLLSPLLNRSMKSPLSPSFPQDSPSTPSPTTTRTKQKQWIPQEKEISCFSPDTPETAAPIGDKAFEISRSFPEDQGPERQQSPPPAYVSNVSSRQNTMTFTFGNQTIQGEAAEYYQACAHELFSKTPYFRCCNHVCSLTPDQPAVLPAGAVGATDEDGSRGLGFMAADAPPSGLGGTQPHESPVAAASTQSTKNAGLLIDIDSPTPETTGNAAHAKEVQVDSPVSNTSIDSWDESVVDKNEKDSAAQASKGAVETTSQPTVAPVPLPLEPMEPVDRHILEPPAPAPVPAAIPMPEPAPAPAPQIITNIAPPTTTVNVASPPQQQPIQPAVQYMPVFPPAGQPTQAMPMEQPPQPPQEFSRGLSPVAQPAPRVASSQSEWPWGDRAQQQEQTQAQQPSNQGQVTGFEWAYSQPEQTQESSITSEPPVPQSAHTQGHKLARKPVFGHADQPQGPLVIQGRQSGSGWPFGIHAHPHSNAPPVPPVSQPASTGVEAESQQEQPGSEQAQAERGVPQGSGLSPPQGHSSASEPISPGFQRAAGGPGSMQMSDMQAPAPAYTQFFREAPLPPRYDIQPRYDYDPAAGASSVNPSGAMGPNETRRRRLEREEAVGRRVCGLWRGRGPFSKKSGRPGREGRTRRRWYFVICIFFFIIVIVATVLAITLTRKGHSTPIQSRWLNLTGYPPMPTGIATLGGTQPQLEKSTCITPASMWSCALPKDQQNDNEPYNANQPNFRISIQFRNGTYDNSTTVDSKSARLRVRDDMFKPSPAAPSDMDQSFLGQYTDNNTAPYAGEGTPFYMSILSPVSLSTANIYRRSLHSNSTAYPNISSIIPAPDENADGTPAAALLYPLPTSQPIRLYNRGLATEHYGFYTYFDKSIFLSSQTKSQKADTNGGTSKSTAEYRCTWSQTRFLVQIWTQPDTLGRHLLPTNNATATSTTTPTSTSTPIPSSATDFSRPGSFPYPVTITLDRHGGAEKKKMVYCYPISDGHYNITAAQLQLEDREVGGALVNPASGLFKGFSGTKNGSGEEYGGVDGGAGGCGCQWVNWISSS